MCGAVGFGVFVGWFWGVLVCFEFFLRGVVFVFSYSVNDNYVEEKLVNNIKER